jgi:hypothetical protein
MSPFAVLCRLLATRLTDTLVVKGCDFMWKRTIAVLLIAGSLYGQTKPVEPGQKPCPDQNLIPGPGTTVVQRNEPLRRGREEDFAVVLCSPKLAYGGCGAEPHPSQTGIVPVSFSIDPPQGLTIQYRDGRKYRPLIAGAPVPYRRGSRVLLLRIRAGDDAPFGVQKLHGNLMFQKVEQGKAVSNEQIDVNFQVATTGHDAKVDETDWRFGSQVSRHMKDVALAPLLPFQYLLFVIVCSTSRCDI